MALQSGSELCLLYHFQLDYLIATLYSNIKLATILIIGAIFLAVFLYWIYYIPMNWTRDLTEVGYKYITKNIRSKEKKVEAINRARRLRKSSYNQMPPPYPNGWFAIAESSSLKPGQVIDVSCLGQNFAVFRTKKDEVCVLDAYCPHLGANIAIGGIVHGDCIECPFHQWTFRGSDGQCVNVPYSSSDSAYKTAKLKKWTSCEINGAIFVWHHAEIEDPWIIPSVKEIETNECVFQGRNEFLVNCHIQEIPENGADVAHLVAVHGPNMLTGSDLRYTRAAWATFGTHTWDANWHASTDAQQKHTALAVLDHSTRLFNKIELNRLHVTAKQIGPSYVILRLNCVLGTIIILQTVTPTEPLLQKVIHRFYAPRRMAFFVKFLIWAESVMFERDMMVWNHKIYLNSPCLVKEDRNIKLYRNWYNQFYSENSKTFAQAKETLEW